MGAQNQAGVTLRTDLMELAEELSFEDLNLAMDKVLPPIYVTERSATYPVLPREARMKIPDTTRAPNGTYSRGQWEWGSNTYTCEQFGHEETIDLTQAMENERYINEEEVSTELAVEGVLLARESRGATALLNPTTFSGSTNTGALTNEWDDPTNAAPFSDIDTAWKVCRAKNGLAKSRYSLILSDDLVNYAIRTDEIRNSVLYVDPIVRMSIEEQRSFLARYFGIKAVIPISSMFDTAGLSQNASIGKFWSNEYAMLAVLSDGRQTFREPSVGRQVVWSRYAKNYIIEDYPEPTRDARVIRAKEYRGIIINVDYGYLLSNMKTTVDATTGV